MPSSDRFLLTSCLILLIYIATRFPANMVEMNATTTTTTTATNYEATTFSPPLPLPPPQNDNDGYAGSPPGLLAEAVYIVTELKKTNSTFELVCPFEQKLGFRAVWDLPERVGNKCEPWITREIVEILWHILRKGMLGLEWSTGSSSLWLLRKGLTVHSIEHCKGWLDQVLSVIQTTLPHLEERWYPHFGETKSDKECSQAESGTWEQKDVVFGEYVRYAKKNLYEPYARSNNGFDLINVDGRFREYCLVEALDMINPNYGILLLDNAERGWFKASVDKIPSHWLPVSFQYHWGENFHSETAIWMACPTKEDVHCARARNEIKQMMEQLPPHAAGVRYKDHMRRARIENLV